MQTGKDFFMKHYIIVKFQEGYDFTGALEDIQEIFSRTLDIEGVQAVQLHLRNNERPNRYDLMIEMTLTPEALPLYDQCAAHHQWKGTYGKHIQEKTIFDCD